MLPPCGRKWQLIDPNSPKEFEQGGGGLEVFL